jgi:hypothetical protein
MCKIRGGRFVSWAKRNRRQVLPETAQAGSSLPGIVSLSFCFTQMWAVPPSPLLADQWHGTYPGPSGRVGSDGLGGPAGIWGGCVTKRPRSLSRRCPGGAPVGGSARRAREARGDAEQRVGSRVGIAGWTRLLRAAGALLSSSGDRGTRWVPEGHRLLGAPPSPTPPPLRLFGPGLPPAPDGPQGTASSRPALGGPCSEAWSARRGCQAEAWGPKSGS